MAQSEDEEETQHKTSRECATGLSFFLLWEINIKSSFVLSNDYQKNTRQNELKYLSKFKTSKMKIKEKHFPFATVFKQKKSFL